MISSFKMSQGKVRMGSFETNHEISGRFTKRRVYVRSKSNQFHPDPSPTEINGLQ